MQVINWSELQPPPADLEALRERLQEALPLRAVCRSLVEVTLRAYPWTGRADLIPCYHPSQTYQPGQQLALLISKPQSIRRSVWLLGQVKQTKDVQNPIQGHFQILTLELHGKQVQMAAGIDGASSPEPDLAHDLSEELAWLVKWVSDTYAAPLQTILKRLIQSGQIRGRLAGETFLPERVSALSPELLHPIFARLCLSQPWISLEELLRGLPDLAGLERETVLGLLRGALKKSAYRALGGDRWTTPELFDQLNRDVPQGLPAGAIRPKTAKRMKRLDQFPGESGSRFLPREARQALAELGLAETPIAPDDSPWRPPKEPVRFPTLNYLHITQAYFPVGGILRTFTPDAQLVFLQFINGDHQPFLLDRENGLLKAVHPEKLRTKVLEHAIPAGTHLWLEYQGNEEYRIAPRPLPFKRRVPCKLAYFEDSQLHIEQSHISMQYEGDPSLFKADLRSEEIEPRVAEASRDRRLGEAMIYVIQEICSSDPDHRAHRFDLFNAIFLEQVCSPLSVAWLLYTQPCFEPVGEDCFRYKPLPAVVRKTRKRQDRLAVLWDHFLTHPVLPEPVAEERNAIGARPHLRYPASPPFHADLERPFLVNESETERERSMTISSYGETEETAFRTTALEEEPLEALLLSDTQTDDSTPAEVGSEGASWKDSLERLLHSIVELEDVDSSLSVEAANPEHDESSDLSIEAAHEESLSFSSPFRWDPRPAWVNPPVQSKPASLSGVEAHHRVYRSKIPRRPLHKQRFYRRYFFYLHSWLSRLFRKTT